MGQPITPTGYALLGLLSFGRELSGYEVKRWADDSLRFFYDSPAMSQVYTELDRLAADGLLATRDVNRGGTRNTRVYRLTRAGRTALRRWLRHTPVPPTALKHHLALRVFLGHLSEPGQLRQMVADHRRHCEEQLAELRAVRDGLDPDDATFHHPWLVADWGISHYEGEVASLDRLLDRLDSSLPSRPR